MDLREVTALVVDDDTETRRVFTEILVGYGARVVSAASAAEAFQIIERLPADVIVMDIGMPKENGFSLLRRIRESEIERGAAATPAIAVTAYTGAGARAEAIEAGFAVYVPKPALPREIIAAILQAIGSSRTSRLRSDA
jgi:CheY-like chemotaxis protein